MKKGIKAVDKSYKDDYTQILQVFTFDKASSAAGGSEFEKTIQKSSKLIKKHSITAKPKKKKANLSKKKKDFFQKKEFCKWVDDAYLIMGKAHFYKQDYASANNTLFYILKNFPDENTNHEAKLMLARSHVEDGDFKNASEYLDLFRAKPYPQNLEVQMQLVYSDFFLKQEKNEDALKHLKKAKEKLKRRNKLLNARITYIMAQIAMQDDKKSKASEYFKEVVKLNPPYEMAFNAKINRATLLQSGEKSDGIKKELKKMLKDEKNDDYQDQIYFALANIFYKENDIKQAKENYRLSSAKSRANKNQKALSCLALADIYFGETKYELSQAYYDTAITFLNKNYPNYSAIYTKTKNLNDLIKNLKTIQEQDSLQRIAKMPETERNLYILKIIEEVKKEEEDKKNAALNNNQLINQNDFSEENNQTSGSFPFYNQSMLAQGMVLFKQKWGDRPLEDNWRRKNKASTTSDINSQNNKQTTDNKGQTLNNKMPEYYTQNLPLTDSLLTVSKEKVEKALFATGEIYDTKIHDTQLAIKQYEEFIKRFPNSKLLLEAYYALYLIYTEQNNNTEASKYRSLIISEFPSSSYAKVFVNPNYANELMASKKLVEDEYLKIYNLFQENKYAEVLTACTEAYNKFPDNFMLHKFKFLEALSIGGTEKPDVTRYREALSNIITKFPNTDVKTACEEILAQLDKNTTVVEKVFNMMYKETPNSPHFYVIACKNPKADLTKIIFQTNKFCALNYNQNNFDVSQLDLKPEVRLVLVKQFQNKNEAQIFFKEISNSPDILKYLKNGEFEHFTMSDTNFASFQKDKDISKYLKFFKATY